MQPGQAANVSQAFISDIYDIYDNCDDYQYYLAVMTNRTALEGVRHCKFLNLKSSYPIVLINIF